MAKNKRLQRVLIMAGGTGGHIFPGLALARCLLAKGVDVHWLGTRAGLEARLVPAASIPLHCVNVGGLRGKKLKTLLAAPYKVFSATMEARQIIRKVKPDIVIGMGGYASGPGGFASWLSSYPLVIHEQNASPGLTNKILARLANRVLEGFPGTFPRSRRVIALGTPVRQEVEELLAPEYTLEPYQGRKVRILILGGSLGSKALNDTVPRAIALLPQDLRPDIWHQTGEKNFEENQHLYRDIGVAAKVVPFITDMHEAYKWADLVICRAGALTVAELCAAGRGAIFIPYPHAVDDHQTANADFMVENQAADCIQQRELTPELLAEQLKFYLTSPEKTVAMAKEAYSLRKIKVAEKIFDILTDVI